MWFAIGILTGYCLHKLFAWMDKGLSAKNSFSEPKGKPLSFSEWERDSFVD